MSPRVVWVQPGDDGKGFAMVDGVLFIHGERELVTSVKDTTTTGWPRRGRRPS